jgi:hypothetical protein
MILCSAVLYMYYAYVYVCLCVYVYVCLCITSDILNMTSWLFVSLYLYASYRVDVCIVLFLFVVSVWTADNNIKPRQYSKHT